jgi:hypothetical protein
VQKTHAVVARLLEDNLHVEVGDAKVVNSHRVSPADI